MAVRGEPVGLTSDEAMAAEQLREGCDRILNECGKVIVGQQDVLELLLIAPLGSGARASRSACRGWPRRS